MKKTDFPLLLLEDDAALSSLIIDELEAEGWQVTAMDRLDAACSWLDENIPSLIITDLRLPDGNGMELVRLVMERFEPEQRPGLIVITAFGSVRQAVAALQAGADDFLTKPLDLDHFMICIERVLENRHLKDELLRFRRLSRQQDFHGMFGNSEAMRRLYEQIRVVSRAQGPVLVSGESGTGKELVAKAIHAESDRAQGPFLAVNCAGIPQELLESEFFGHASGAFTGADRVRKGLLQEADGGTLMLDEIGEMPLSLQAKLLRALQDGSIRPVGQDKEEKVNVRIVAATHQDLQQKVGNGLFREDLYYRLETFTLTVPALRQRAEDLELLAQRFLEEFAVSQGKQIEGFSEEALSLLQTYTFPGNVRELQNMMERAVAYCRQGLIQPEHLPERLRQGQRQTAGPLSENLQNQLLEGPVLPTMEQLQKRYARMVLEQAQGNKRRAAALLGIGRRTLYRWLDEVEQQD